MESFVDNSELHTLQYFVCIFIIKTYIFFFAIRLRAPTSLLWVCWSLTETTLHSTLHNCIDTDKPFFLQPNLWNLWPKIIKKLHWFKEIKKIFFFTKTISENSLETSMPSVIYAITFFIVSRSFVVSRKIFTFRRSWRRVEKYGESRQAFSKTNYVFVFGSYRPQLVYFSFLLVNKIWGTSTRRHFSLELQSQIFMIIN